MVELQFVLKTDKRVAMLTVRGFFLLSTFPSRDAAVGGLKLAAAAGASSTTAAGCALPAATAS